MSSSKRTTTKRTSAKKGPLDALMRFNHVVSLDGDLHRILSNATVVNNQLEAMENQLLDMIEKRGAVELRLLKGVDSRGKPANRSQVASAKKNVRLLEEKEVAHVGRMQALEDFANGPAFQLTAGIPWVSLRAGNGDKKEAEAIIAAHAELKDSIKARNAYRETARKLIKGVSKGDADDVAKMVTKMRKTYTEIAERSVQAQRKFSRLIDKHNRVAAVAVGLEKAVSGHTRKPVMTTRVVLKGWV